jgi:hypothetical protein
VNQRATISPPDVGHGWIKLSNKSLVCLFFFTISCYLLVICLLDWCLHLCCKNHYCLVLVAIEIFTPIFVTVDLHKKVWIHNKYKIFMFEVRILKLVSILEGLTSNFLNLKTHNFFYGPSPSHLWSNGSFFIKKICSLIHCEFLFVCPLYTFCSSSRI